MCYEFIIILLLFCFMGVCLCCLCFFFVKQKTAYEMRISDWSSDVCSSDLDSARPGASTLLIRMTDPAEGAANIVAIRYVTVRTNHQGTPGMAETRKAGRSRRQDERREKILQAATEVFFKSGFAGASIDEVIAKVGGSKRTIYDYFGNKEELFAAIVREIPARALPPLDAEEISSQDLETMLHEVGRRYLDVIMSPPAPDRKSTRLHTSH